MPLPDYQTFMLPILKIASNGSVFSPRPMANLAADHFQLTDEERNEMLPSGAQSTLHNRVNWAMYYLYRAGLMKRPTKGKYLISDRGREVLAANPEKIDTTFLRQFESFKDFVSSPSKSSTVVQEVPAKVTLVDPLEQLEQTAAVLKDELASELRET